MFSSILLILSIYTFIINNIVKYVKSNFHFMMFIYPNITLESSAAAATARNQFHLECRFRTPVTLTRRRFSSSQKVTQGVNAVKAEEHFIIKLL